MITIIAFIFVLGILVLVHELGHFIAAKKAGCTVDEFAIGFPPRLFTIKKGGTNYSINLLPLGGYVKIVGEDGGGLDDPNSFGNKSFGWKSLIISAGVLMNMLLAYVFITIGLMVGVPTVIDEGQEFGKFARVGDQQVQVVSVLDDTPASIAGLLRKDVIKKINDEDIETVNELQGILGNENIELVSIEVERGEEMLSIDVMPEKLEEIDSIGIGVGLAETAKVSYPWYVAPFYGVERTFSLLWLILSAFGALIAGIFAGNGVGADIAGPIGIAVITGEVARLGIIQLLQFTAILSINLAIINILPFPALDGSRLLFIVIEKIRKKKTNVEFEKWLHIIGFSLLMLLMVAITIKDIGTYGSGIWESIRSIF